jgi:hypothetical protein
MRVLDGGRLAHQVGDQRVVVKRRVGCFQRRGRCYAASQAFREVALDTKHQTVWILESFACKLLDVLAMVIRQAPAWPDSGHFADPPDAQPG